MSADALNLDVPEEFHDWPHDTRSFVLAEANTVQDLREEIHSIVGIDEPIPESETGAASCFPKKQMAQIVLALGEPQGVADD